MNAKDLENQVKADAVEETAEAVTEETVEEMRSILAEIDPEMLESGKVINIAEMKLETFRKLESFAKSKFKERGEVYPV